MFKNIINFCWLLIASALLGGYSGLALGQTLSAIDDASTNPKPKVELLFVMHSKDGELTKTDDGYMLELQHINRKVMYFADRPVREAGLMKLTSFGKLWNEGIDSFKANPPNASIVYDKLDLGEDKTKAVAVELSQMTIDGKGWSFHVKDLEGKLKPQDIHSVSLLIDVMSASQGYTAAINWLNNPPRKCDGFCP